MALQSRNRTVSGRLLIGLSTGFGFLLLAGCTSEGATLEDSPGSAEAAAEVDAEDQEHELVPVEVVELATGSIEATLRYSTNLEAENDVQVFSQASRLVTELLVEEGDRVARGELLLKLQDDEQRSAVASATSQLRKAEREHERQRRLFDRQLISEQAFNDASYELEQQQLAFENAERELSYTEVRAPIAGTVTARLVNLGDHITFNQHLFDIIDFDSIVARVFVPERERRRLAVGQTARLFAESLGGEPRRGRVLRIAPVVDARSGTIKTTVAIPAHQGLQPGMFVEVELVTDVHTEALLVPKRALVYDNEQVFAFRIVDNSEGPPTAERLLVRPRLEDRSWVEPAGDQLVVGDRLVVAGQQGLKDGIKVRLLGAVPGGAEEAEEEEAEPAAREAA